MAGTSKSKVTETKAERKTCLDIRVSHTYYDLVEDINAYNRCHPDTPILKEDIAEIREKEGTYMMLYYK
jgi:hypothetical protein